MVLAGITLAVGSVTFAGRPAAAQTPEEEIQAALDDAVAAWNAGDAETFASFFTPEGLEDQFDIEPGGDLGELEVLMEELGPLSITVLDSFITSGNARVEVQIEAGPFSSHEEWKMYFLDGGWKIGTSEPVAPEIPEGVPVVDMFLQEYAFLYNADAIVAADGNVAFRVFNIGEQEHEVILVRNETGKSILEVLETAEESEGPPPGITDVGFGGPIDPGDETALVLDEPLSPGTYSLLCFIPSPDGVPHAFLGMVSEFTVPGVGGAPISPPSTGDAGLLDRGTGTTTWLLLGVALLLVTAGGAGSLAGKKER